MSFLMPKPPKVVSTPAATPAVQADASQGGGSAASMVTPNSGITTSSQGLTRKARTQKPSLIGSSVAN